MVKMKKVVVLGKSDLLNSNAAPSAELIATALEANGRASRFVYSATEIVALALRAERRLERSGLPQADRVGFRARFEHKGPAAKAYKYSAAGCAVTLRRTARGWVLESIDEITVFPAQSERVTYRATPKQIEEMQRRSVNDITPLRVAA